jgi:RNA polymerase sigma factor (sigma-70 family)
MKGVEQKRREFTEFYVGARDECLRVVLVSVGDRQLAEDLVAEAFTRAWMSWRKVRAHPAPRAWVVRTAFNVNVSWWRRRRREVVLAPGDAPASADRFPEPDDELVAAVRALPTRQRQVVTLRVFYDLDTETTAALLGISPGTVGAHLHRAATAALGTTLALVLGQPAGRSVHVNLDAWSVNSNPGGTVTVTLRELRDPAVLRRVLAQAGLPAVVSFGKFCVPVTPGAVVPFFRPGSLDPAAGLLVAPPTRMGDGILTLNPAALPKGTELNLGVEPGISEIGAGRSFAVTMDVIRRGAPLVCHTPVPRIPPNNPYHSK